MTGGVTSITVTISSSQAIGTIEFVEYSFTSGPVSFDNDGVATLTTCNPCTGPTLTLTGANDVIVQYTATGNTCSNVSAPYTAPKDFPAGNGVAGAVNINAGTAVSWTYSGSTSGAAAALAIKAAPVPAGKRPISFQ